MKHDMKGISIIEVSNIIQNLFWEVIHDTEKLYQGISKLLYEIDKSGDKKVVYIW